MHQYYLEHSSIDDGLSAAGFAPKLETETATGGKVASDLARASCLHLTLLQGKLLFLKIKLVEHRTTISSTIEMRLMARNDYW